MRTSYVHDWIVFEGGAESVLRMLLRHGGIDETTTIFVLYSPHRSFVVDQKQIPLVTALPGRLNRWFARGSTTQIQRGKRLFDYRNLMPIYPVLCRLLRRKIHHHAPEKLIISSFAAAKNVVPRGGRSLMTILYVHSPMQYIRENYDEYITKLSGLKNIFFKRTTRFLRPWDSAYRSYTSVYANSRYTIDCAKKYYDLDADLWYPDIDDAFYSQGGSAPVRDYFVYVGRLVRFIREVDKLIMWANEQQIPLLVIGSGPDEAYLKKLAGPTITFVGHVSDVHEKIQLIRSSRGLINLAKESCGLSTMEALLLGVPVFGFLAGGSEELLREGEMVEENSLLLMSSFGVGIREKTPSAFAAGRRAFIAYPRDRGAIQQRMRAYLSAHQPHLHTKHDAV